MPTVDTALAGRTDTMPVPPAHFVNGQPLAPPFPAHCQQAVFGMGCFWGAERSFWERDGVYVTAVGYIGGITANPTYEEVCSGMTGHTEGVLVVYDPARVSFGELLGVFWEGHDPTQGMRQGNDLGTQYRSGIYTFGAVQLDEARSSLTVYGASLREAGFADITTEIQAAPQFYYAEHYHQQYLAKVPNGFCGIGGTGVCYAREATAQAVSRR